MNGFTFLNMPNEFRQSATAEKLAKQIFDGCTVCLMAHSIRATEKHLREVYKFDTQIVLQPCLDVLTDMGRLSWSSVAQNSGHLTYIRYWDNHEFENSRKRFCIAHELYHVIWSIASSSSVTRGDKTAELACDHFANELCGMHDAFYVEHSKSNNVYLRFQGLPFRSV